MATLFRVMMATLMCIACGACIGSPDEDDTRWLEDGVNAISLQARINLIRESDILSVCQKILETRDANNSWGERIGTCGSSSDPLNHDIYMSREEFAFRCSLTGTSNWGESGMWLGQFLLNLKAEEYFLINGLGAPKNCVPSPEFFGVVSEAEEEVENGLPRDTTTSVAATATVVGMALMAALNPTRLLALAPGLSLILSNHCHYTPAMAVYCEPPPPGTIPVTPGNPYDPDKGDSP